MSEIAELVDYLNNCPMDTAPGCVEGTGLAALHKRVFNNKTLVTKKDVVQNLSAFYANKQNLINIWNGLSECEQDFLKYILQCGGEYLPTTLIYAKKHNLKLEYVTSNGYKKNITSPFDYTRLKFLHLLTWNIPNTQTVLLFPGGDMPSYVFDFLKNLVGPIKFECVEYIPAKTDYIICRENQVSDFATIVKLATSERLKVKSTTLDLTPAKLAKLSELMGFEEVCDKDGCFCSPKEAKRSNDFKVAQPLFILATNSGLLDIDKEGFVCPGKEVSNLLSGQPHELAKHLFNDYITKNAISEIRYITYVAFREGYWQINWSECRKTIIDLLKKCPVEKFLKFEDFNNYARLFCGPFFRRLFYGDVIVKGYKFNNYYYGFYKPDWDECEAQIIRLILSFLSAMGLVDIAYTENVARIRYANDDFCVGIAGFRITKLGAWVFGLTDKYRPTKTVSPLNDQGQLIVLPDYSVIISGLKCRIEHETYFSKFLTKISVDGNAAIYKLDFPSVIRAHDNNITPQKIKKDLQKANDKPLPDNVVRSLDDWQLKIGRVKIHSLTVLETDDALLLEEIKHIKGFSSVIKNDLLHAIAIDGNQQKKAKTLIEKNGWPVKI
ncbi:MAG: helicase-associated domain-containing protein [Candidatus Bathyarchaeota archaeon]|nr:helicase-associated domain-containing protein [Candidatus Termiticorpusculum sp.]MCL2868275.1 helicase-associated domain-containing protein [Candidatus Termiticorpusculum sp.]